MGINLKEKMTLCNRCNDKTELEWFEDFQGKWKLGIKLDINNYRPHKCVPQNDMPQQNNKRNWSNFICEKCQSKTRQNLKLVKSLNLCLGCQSY